MKQKNILFFTTVLIIAVSSFQCGQSLSGVETTNGATAVVQTCKVTGTAPPFAMVYLFDKDYIPCIDKGLGVATAADNNGRFQFNQVRGDVFTVEVMCDYDSQSVVFCAGCNGADTARSSLFKPGTLDGSVTASSGSDSILVFLNGTGFYKILKNSGTFVFNALPQGTYQLQAANIYKNQSGALSLRNVSVAQEVKVSSERIVTTTIVLP